VPAIGGPGIIPPVAGAPVGPDATVSASVNTAPSFDNEGSSRKATGSSRSAKSGGCSTAPDSNQSATWLFLCLLLVIKFFRHKRSNLLTKA
jgi:hypothetical protein